MIPKAVVQTDSALAARCAAIASVGAGLIHFAVMPSHWLNWWAAGLFFAPVAVFQLMWAYLAWSRPRPLLLAAGIAANAGIAVLLVVSSTAGLPFGPHAGVAEAMDTAGICALLLECYVIMGAAWAWMQDYEPEAVSRFRSALVLLGANGVIAATVCVGVASSLHHGDHHAPLEAQRGTPHHHTSPVAPPQSGVPEEPAAPAPEDAGLPVADMALHGDGEHPHG
ncbi:MAG: hypothetical protein WCP30_01360 [Mycobacteriaceae bacterium]